MKHTSNDITLKNLTQKIEEAHFLCNGKKWDEAFAIAQICHAQFPNNAKVYQLLGRVYFEKGNLLESERSFNIAVSLEPKDFEGYYLLAQFLGTQKRFDEAKNAYVECVKLNPKHAQAFFNLATIYHHQGKKQDAIQAYNQAITLRPTFYKAYHQLGILYHFQNQLPQAIDAYLKALEGEAEAKDVSLLSNIGAALTRDRQFGKAVEFYEKAIALDPKYTPAISNLGGTYIEMNQHENAEGFLRRSLELDNTLAGNWRNLTLCTHYTTTNNPDYDHIKKLLGSTKISEEDQVHLYFALGKIYDDCKKYSKAFEFYHLGNQIKAKRTAFREQSFSNHIQRVIKIFSEIEYQDFDFEEEEIQPIMIVGSPRSGKSMLENLLTQHPLIKAVGEIGIAEFSERLPIEFRPKGSYPYWMKSLTKDQALAIRQGYLARLKRDEISGKQYLIDTIPGNFMYLGLIKMLFPKAKIVHCKRVSYDACLSMYFKYFIDGHGYTYDLAKLGNYYQQYQRMMAFWVKMLPPNTLFEINYEDIIFHKEKAMQPLLQYLDIDVNFDFNYDKVSHKEIGHWQLYQAHLKPLLQALNAPLPSIESESEELNYLRDMMSTAYFQYEQENYDGAFDLCKIIIKEDANHYAAYHLMGVILHRQGDFNLAIEFFEKAIQLAPNVVQAHVDIANAYQALGKQMQAENHLKIAQMLQQQQTKSYQDSLKIKQREELLGAFTCPIDIEDEFEKKMLLKGEVAQDLTTQSYMTRSWDQYFTDLSYGSFKDGNISGRHVWRMRAWHFAFKNIALVDVILKQLKPHIRILDIGCSTGYLRRFLEGNLNQLDKKEIYYWGVDVRQDVLLSAIKEVDDIESGAKGNLVPSAFIWHDIAHGLPFKDSYFDFVVNFEMIKYLPVEQGKRLLAEMYRVLKPKGQLFLSTTHSSHHPGFMESVPFAQLEAFLSQNGFAVIGRRGSQSNFAALSTHIEPDHLPLVKALLQVHPPEMVAAMITPLYPQFADQIMLQCKISE